MSSVPKGTSATTTDTTRREVQALQATATPAHWRLGFWSLIATQFQGAFNDNGLKFLVIYLILDRNFPPAQRDW
ncbi:MAG TPA: hypothetical protein VH161_00770, partial [Candidatus Acidoferrales bacterium]|nr:hypothetical protein [Candidatus Acidoferrales bacterium]